MPAVPAAGGLLRAGPRPLHQHQQQRAQLPGLRHPGGDTIGGKNSAGRYYAISMQCETYLSAKQTYIS